MEETQRTDAAFDYEQVNHFLSSTAYSFPESTVWKCFEIEAANAPVVLQDGASFVIDLGDALHHGSGLIHSETTDHGVNKGSWAYRNPATSLTITGPLTAAGVLDAISDAVRRDSYRNFVLWSIIQRPEHRELLKEYRNMSGLLPAKCLDILSPLQDPTAGLSTEDVVKLACFYDRKAAHEREPMEGHLEEPDYLDFIIDCGTQDIEKLEKQADGRFVVLWSEPYG